MTFNLLILVISAIVPLFIGFIWYHPKVFGKVWMEINGLTEEKLKEANMLLIFFLCFLFSFFIATVMNSLVIHQNHFFSILMNEPGLKDSNSDIGKYVADFMAKHGKNFRTFKHGLLHGTLTGVFFAFPLIGINAIFERRGFKYIALHSGYWILCLGIMGGIICQFS